MKEIKSERRYYTKSINRHSIRVYGFNGKEYALNKVTDVKPCYYSFYEMEDGRLIKVEGENTWGEGLSWSKAEAKAWEALNGQLS